MNYTTISCRIDGAVATVAFNRPEIHNAFNATVIAELTHAFTEISRSPVRVVVLTGEGKSFCSGADLNWMRSVINQSFEEHLSEATHSPSCFI